MDNLREIRSLTHMILHMIYFFSCINKSSNLLFRDLGVTLAIGLAILKKDIDVHLSTEISRSLLIHQSEKKSDRAFTHTVA